MSDLQERLERVARGRTVTVHHVTGGPFSHDFAFRYDEARDAYDVQLTDAGLFEEALRSLERWIARHAAQRDVAYTPPPRGHLDLGAKPLYWLVERHGNQLLADLESAVGRYAEYVAAEMYYRPREGEVVIEQRISALQGLLRHFDAARSDLRSGVLSPHTVDVLRTADILPRTDPE